MNPSTTVLSIGSDRNLFREGSAVRARTIEYGKLFKELHIVVFALKGVEKEAEQIAPNVWIYPTDSHSRIFYVNDAIDLGRKIIREQEFQPENSVITTQDPFEAGLVGVVLKRSCGLPLHVQAHTDFLSPHFKRESRLNRIRTFLAPFVMKRADAVRVVSERLKEKACSTYRLDPTKVAVLPVFVDIEAIAEISPKCSLRERHPGFSTIILMASRLTSEKNISFALKAFARVLKRAEGAALVIAGDGPLEWKLKKEAEMLGIAEHVFFDGWQDDLVPYYKTADIFLLSSSFEGYGMTVVEAAACSLPVLATDVGIVREIVPQHFERFICPQGDVEGFAKRLEELVENTEMRKEFGAMLFESAMRLVRTRQEYFEKYIESIELALSR